MLKILFLICSLPFCLVAQDIRIVDFHDAVQPDEVQGHKAWLLGDEAYNFSPELTPFFRVLQQEYNSPVAMETGTNEGRTAVGLAGFFNTVHTIEIVDSRYDHVKAKLAPFSNVFCHLGDSAKLLSQLASQYQNDTLFFYLDAHGGDSWPLLDELNVIGQTHKDNCIVVIDDFKVPGRSDIHYDAWGYNECSYEYIQGGLAKIFSEYECCIVIPKNLSGRAKFVAFPKKWGIKGLQAAGYF